MTRTFCDRCNFEMKEGEHPNVVRFTYTANPNGGDHVKELCKTCYDAWRDMVQHFFQKQ